VSYNSSGIDFSNAARTFNSGWEALGKALPFVRMMTLKRLTCLWPGLLRLWYRGQWGGLAVACLFSAAVNVVVASTLLWPEFAPTSLRAAGICLLATWWLVAALLSFRELPEIAASTHDDPYKGLFMAAQTEYLKGNWIEAEAHVRKLLRRRPRDVESLLLLATLKRRTRRWDEARRQLQYMARLDAAAAWQVEIRTERELQRRELERRRIAELQESNDISSPQTPAVSNMSREEDATGKAAEREPSHSHVEMGTNQYGARLAIDDSEHRRAA